MLVSVGSQLLLFRHSCLRRLKGPLLLLYLLIRPLKKGCFALSKMMRVN